VAQVLAHHIVWQVKACGTADERFGPEIQRRQVGAEPFRQRQRRLQAHLCRLGLVKMNQEVLDRHCPLLP
jgi:hypothetical protein